MSSDSRTRRRSRGSAAALAALLLGVGSVCSSGTGEPSPASTAAATTATPAPAEPERISGDFEISNTTPGGADAVVETIVVSIETAAGDSAWTAVPSLCSTTPAPPIRIATSMRIAYECLPSSAGPSDARRRVVVLVAIAGSDEVFRIVSEIP